MSNSNPIEFPQGGGAIHGIGETFNSNAFSGTSDLPAGGALRRTCHSLTALGAVSAVLA